MNKNYEIKYDIDDEVYFLYDNRIFKGVISAVRIDQTKAKTQIRYSMDFNNYCRPTNTMCYEGRIFKNQNDLIDTIKIKEND